MSIEVLSVSKNYGNQKALDTVSFEIHKGEIVGFLGPNGAGKSTMMKILTGFLLPTEGVVLINGVDVVKNPLKIKKQIGYLPEHNPLYQEMYVKEYLQFHASIHKVVKSEIDEVVKKVGLTPESHKKIKHLSKGYQQRVGLAAAILHHPKILILDEPTTGLDPNQLLEIRTLIKELGKEKTVLFSTHIMQEVEAICNRVIIIKKGKILVDKPLKELQETHQQIIEVTFNYKIEEQFVKRLPQLQSYKNKYDSTWLLTFNTSDDMRAVVFDFAQENGLKILGLNTQNQKLEELFNKVTK